jgi:UDP-galactopyranose mutase
MSQRTPNLPALFSDQLPLASADLLCLSHLRWNFVYQRPQHLMSRVARERRVFFFEEPVGGAPAPFLELRQEEESLTVAVPHLPDGLGEAETVEALEGLLAKLFEEQRIRSFVSWYYTPMALKFTRHLRPVATVYDCMDQLSHFKDAPREIVLLERELLKRVDVLFTGGHSLFEEKRALHPRAFAFPSSVDVEHFSQARRDDLEEPADQAGIPHPRIGYLGVIDERLDIDLLLGVAESHPEWQLVLAGPVVKIDPATLPHLPNVHYLGMKSYAELPAYLAGWDVAMLPFARNEATRFISPTKTPEYLAAGRRTVSTSIRDVVRPYGEQELVEIADRPEELAAAIGRLLADGPGHAQWLERVDTMLSASSWDRTHDEMWQQIGAALESRRRTRPAASTARAEVAEARAERSVW